MTRPIDAYMRHYSTVSHPTCLNNAEWDGVLEKIITHYNPAWVNQYLCKICTLKGLDQSVEGVGNVSDLIFH